MISLQETLEDSREKFKSSQSYDVGTVSAATIKSEPEAILKEGVIVARRYPSGIEICERAYQNGWDDVKYLKYPTSYGTDYCLEQFWNYTSGTFTVGFDKLKNTEILLGGQDLISFFKEVGELTQRERLVRGKDKVFKKLFEEIGEYAVASLGDKAVTESPRQELVDCLIMLFSLFTLEGGNLDFLASYGKVKLDKWKKKLEEEGI